MLVAYARRRRQLERVEAALGGQWPVTGTLSWAEFEERAEEAECAIVALRRITPRSVPEGLLAFGARFPHVPLVVVTRRRAANVRALSGLEVEEVVWDGSLDESLAPAVGSARTSGVLGRARRRVTRATHLPPMVKEALELALEHEPPLRTVSGWARAVDRDRRTLWYHWRKLAPQGGGGESEVAVSPKELLAWIQLVRAVAARRPGRSWTAVAGALGVDTRTLRRRAKALVGRPLAELEFAEEEVRRGFETRLERLLEATNRDSDTLT